MVKVDYKHDYYADLELTSSADTESIKKRFRDLAKQYHPDRNPGREVDVVPKFQAIQAAHEILGDPNQKAKYDAERAKSNRPRDTESPNGTFKKPAAPPRTNSGFPASQFTQPTSQPPPRRDQGDGQYAQSRSSWRPQTATPSSADRFAKFARAAPPPQQWDRSRFEETARAEGLKGMNAMRGGTSQPSPHRTHHPTAPKSAGADPYSSGPEPSPGFPGMNRTARQEYPYRRTSGDEAPLRSAYARLHRSERDRPTSAAGFATVDPHKSPQDRDPTSPLKQARSFQSDDYSSVRPGLSRNSSRYATAGGEKTQINTVNLGRSTSVRNSPISREWEERGPFGARAAADERIPRPRHRSHSPTARGKGAHAEFSGSETSSDDDDIPPPESRPKAPLRRPKTEFVGKPPEEGPGLTGYFPNYNYTQIVDDHTYKFPPPESKGRPVRKPFTDMTSPIDRHDANLNGETFDAPSQEGASHSSAHDQSSPEKEKAAFSASDWHETFDNHADMFQPPPTSTGISKSPTRNPRNSRSAATRSYVSTKEANRSSANGDIDPNIAAGVSYVDANDIQNKTPAFEPRKSSKDMANPPQTNGKARHESFPQADDQLSGTYQEHGFGAEFGATREGVHATSDEMDIDSPVAPDTSSAASSEGPYNVTVEEEVSPASPIESTIQHAQRRPSANHGINFHDFSKTAPFAPSDTGLQDLGELSTNLPFKSRPSKDLETLHRIPSSTLRDLQLPRPPKPPFCPDDADIDSQSWRAYGDAMTNYMHAWNKFNAAMIEHFRARQEAITHGMYRNWVCAQGDGATAEDFEASGGSDRAGFKTYMTWLDDDRKCRIWWETAFEEHRECMEGLGRVRHRVKELSNVKSAR